MPVRRYIICDHCGDEMIEHDKLRGEEARRESGIRYGEIVESEEPFFYERHGWTVKAYPDPEDPIAIDFDYFCRSCTAEDAIFDSGDVY